MSNYKLSTKNKFEGVNINLDVKKNSGYKITPKNKVKYEGVVVNEMCIIKPSLIEKLLRKKISIKLDNYLQYIITVLDDDDSDTGRISVVLSDLNRYRDIVRNNYIQYLNEKYVELLLKKIELLEYELKKKFIELNAYNYEYSGDLFENEPIKEGRRAK